MSTDGSVILAGAPGSHGREAAPALGHHPRLQPRRGHRRRLTLDKSPRRTRSGSGITTTMIGLVRTEKMKATDVPFETESASTAAADGYDLSVDGVRDLVDFFPLHLSPRAGLAHPAARALQVQSSSTSLRRSTMRSFRTPFSTGATQRIPRPHTSSIFPPPGQPLPSHSRGQTLRGLSSGSPS